MPRPLGLCVRLRLIVVCVVLLVKGRRVVRARSIRPAGLWDQCGKEVGVVVLVVLVACGKLMSSM